MISQKCIFGGGYGLSLSLSLSLSRYLSLALFLYLSAYQTIYSSIQYVIVYGMSTSSHIFTILLALGTLAGAEETFPENFTKKKWVRKESWNAISISPWFFNDILYKKKTFSLSCRIAELWRHISDHFMLTGNRRILWSQWNHLRIFPSSSDITRVHFLQTDLILDIYIFRSNQ